MSRGLGKLQRQILEHLEDPLPAYEGTGMSEARVYGADCILGDGIYDLRWVSKRVWRKLVNSPATMRGRSGMDGDRSRAYDAAFSRAVKGLVKRRILWPLDTVPLIVTGMPTGALRQVRFGAPEVQENSLRTRVSANIRLLALNDLPNRPPALIAKAGRRSRRRLCAGAMPGPKECPRAATYSPFHFPAIMGDVRL
jgi:hypothetical protein